MSLLVIPLAFLLFFYFPRSGRPTSVTDFLFATCKIDKHLYCMLLLELKNDLKGRIGNRYSKLAVHHVNFVSDVSCVLFKRLPFK